MNKSALFVAVCVFVTVESIFLALAVEAISWMVKNWQPTTPVTKYLAIVCILGLLILLTIFTMGLAKFTYEEIDD